MSRGMPRDIHSNDASAMSEEAYFEERSGSTPGDRAMAAARVAAARVAEARAAFGGSGSGGRSDLAGTPRHASSSSQAPANSSAGDDEVDPLDAFMAGINAEISRSTPAAKPQKAKAAWEDLQAEDPVASYFEAYEQSGSQQKRRKLMTRPEEDGSDAEDDDEDDAPEEGDRRDKPIEPLPRIDHTQMKYNPVKTDFYTPHPEIAQMTSEEAARIRSELKISTTGSNVVNAVVSFAHLSHVLGKELMDGIRQHGYQQPTPIQAQAIPVALSGRDVIGVAETGSGKTVAYLLPMLVHAAAQPVLQKDEGPIGVVLCPTRELAIQIEKEVYKFNKRLGLRSVTLAGGLSKLEQFKEIKRGAEIAIGNPGRFIDVVKMKGCNLQRVTMIVLDEADRMLQMGFEYQVRSIVENVRPSRQTLFFSATFPPKIERLARDLLQQPVRITIGEGGQVASNVAQSVVVLKTDDEKWPWLSKHVDAMLAKGQLLVFVKSIASAEELAQNFSDFLEKKSVFLHGDLDQAERMRIISAYRKKQVDVLIASDVAARGLDIPSIATVVSYDVARDIETHTHRVGRTGRAGASGEAFTLITQDESNRKMAALLVENLEQANREVPADLRTLAMKFAPYRAAKLAGREFDGNKKKKGGEGGAGKQKAFGLGFDGKSAAKETPQELEKRLNMEADRMAAANRARMQTGGQGRGGFGAASGMTGFVAASIIDEKPQLKSTKPDSDSDEDLFAPGVTSAFGRGGPKSQKR